MADNTVDGFRWSAEHRVVVLDAAMSEAEMIVALARGIRLAVDRGEHTTP